MGMPCRTCTKFAQPFVCEMNGSRVSASVHRSPNRVGELKTHKLRATDMQKKKEGARQKPENLYSHVRTYYNSGATKEGHIT